MISWLRKILPGGSSKPAPSRNAGDPFVVNLYDDRLVVHRPDAKREELEWDALERVVVRVSNRDPWAGKAWLILVGREDEHGHGHGCVVPVDAVNHDALLQRLQALPGFQQQKLDNALRDARAGKSRSDAICWKRSAADANAAGTTGPDADDPGQH
jgi:hypothetical protein